MKVYKQYMKYAKSDFVTAEVLASNKTDEIMKY